VRTLAAAEVAGARVLVLFTIGETPWTDVHRSVIHDRLRAGTLAIVAIHSASDSCYSWPAYGTLVGARFDGHPWTQALDIDVVVRDHPATAHLGPTWRWTDEVYQFRELRPDATVLLRAPLDQLDLAVAGADPPAFGYPLAWCHREGQGSVFATALGHFPAAWESPTYLRHVHGGLRWALTASEPQGA
jgi:type 1 glutamine amidotransferase